MLTTYVKPLLKWLATRASRWNRRSAFRRPRTGHGDAQSDGTPGTTDKAVPADDFFSGMDIPDSGDRSKLLQEFIEKSDFSDSSSSSSSSTTPVCWHWRRSRIPLSFTAILWTLLSISVSALCTFSLLLPYWIAHPDLVTSFGLMGKCVRDLRYEQPRSTCSAYGDSGFLGGLPAGAWQAACVFFGGGCVLQILAALGCLLVLIVPEPAAQRLAVLTGFVQTVAVLIMIAGLVLFPLGFGSPFFRYYCGEAAGAYCSGHCQMGWGYMLAVMGTALALFCPVLSNFADVRTFSSSHDLSSANTV